MHLSKNNQENLHLYVHIWIITLCFEAITSYQNLSILGTEVELGLYSKMDTGDATRRQEEHGSVHKTGLPFRRTNDVSLVPVYAGTILSSHTHDLRGLHRPSTSLYLQVRSWSVDFWQDLPNIGLHGSVGNGRKRWSLPTACGRRAELY